MIWCTGCFGARIDVGVYNSWFGKLPTGGSIISALDICLLVNLVTSQQSWFVHLPCDLYSVQLIPITQGYAVNVYILRSVYEPT